MQKEKGQATEDSLDKGAPTQRRTFLKMAGALAAGIVGYPLYRNLFSSSKGSVIQETVTIESKNFILEDAMETTVGRFKLPDLPYAKDALAPYLSAETFTYHYGKHHQAYVDNLNKLVPGTEFEKMTLKEIIRRSSGPIFNNAAQHWNHSFYWKSLSDQKNQSPKGALAQAIDGTFGSRADFEKQFTEAAVKLFGSGWAWLSWSPEEKKLKIETTSNAALPLTGPNEPLFTCDVWEHAYYIDYRNARAKYLDSFWKVLNWDFAGKNFDKKKA